MSNAVTTFGGRRFRLMKVAEGYTVAVPVDDPAWLLKHFDVEDPKPCAPPRKR